TFGAFAPALPALPSLPTLLGQEAPPKPAPAGTPAPQTEKKPLARPPLPELPFVDEFVLKSECVSAFWKKERSIRAGVVRPLDWKEGEKLPVAYNIHGFGGSHRNAWRLGPQLQKDMQAGTAPRMLYVFLEAQYEWGHHEFADSRCNGPWGKALTTEFIPALEKKFGVVGEPSARFVTGHSSGGWSSLWLQVTYPEFFGGCWATSPD